MQSLERCNPFEAIHYGLKANTHSRMKPTRPITCLGRLLGNLADNFLSNLNTKNNYEEIGKPVVLGAVFASNM